MGPTSYNQPDVSGLDETFGMGQAATTSVSNALPISPLDVGSIVDFPLGENEPNVPSITDLSEVQ
jgi:hypothetical protein